MTEKLSQRSFKMKSIFDNIKIIIISLLFFQCLPEAKVSSPSLELVLPFLQSQSTDSGRNGNEGGENAPISFCIFNQSKFNQGCILK